MILKLGHKIPLEDVLQRIEYADHEEIDAIIDALKRRYKRLFPGWEVAFLSLPGENRREQARLMMEFIQQHALDS